MNGISQETPFASWKPRHQVEFAARRSGIALTTHRKTKDYEPLADDAERWLELYRDKELGSIDIQLRAPIQDRKSS